MKAHGVTYQAEADDDKNLSRVHHIEDARSITTTFEIIDKKMTRSIHQFASPDRFDGAALSEDVPSELAAFSSTP